jgi:hypothetical protein
MLELQPPRAAKWPQIKVLYEKNLIYMISKNLNYRVKQKEIQQTAVIFKVRSLCQG